MRPSYLGKILLRWCDHCHVPVLAKTCACGEKTREVPVTPPGDARPAFDHDIRQINAIFQEHFGAPLIPEGQIALLNKVPDQDRMEEIVVGGGIAGSIRYLPGRRCFEPLPRPEAGAIIRPQKGYVVIDESAVPFIRDQSMSVLAPGVVSISGEVRAGDEVFILDPAGTCVGVGRAKADAAAARAMEKGVVVRTRRNTPSAIVPGRATWEDALRANAAVLDRMETAAVEFVKETAAQHPLPATVSYSGGKDSLATFLVVQKALGKVPLIFADTGMEFPETYENLDAVARRYGAEVVRTSGNTLFWETCGRDGPPAVNARWCCGVCKLEPVAALIRSRYGECLSFIGQRKYESQTRADSDRVWRNPKVGVQLNAAPIHAWTALHVWLYLFREQAPYNTLYGCGMDRIGCYMCPSCDLAVLHGIAASHPALWKGWQEFLERWQNEHGLPLDWVENGTWRIRK